MIKLTVQRRQGPDLILKSRHKLYLNSQRFAEYTSTVLLPYIDERRSNEEFAAKEVALLMNNFSFHVQAETLQMLTEYLKGSGLPNVNSNIWLLFPILVIVNQFRISGDSPSFPGDLRYLFNQISLLLR
jgi:hypothetical protein